MRLKDLGGGEGLGPSSILLWQERGGLKNAGILAWQFIVLGVAVRINSALSPGLLFPLLMNMLFRTVLSPVWVLGLPWPTPESASCLARTALGPHAYSWLEQPVSLCPYPELLLLAGANKPLPVPGVGLRSLGEDLVFQHQLLFFWVPDPCAHLGPVLWGLCLAGCWSEGSLWTLVDAQRGTRHQDFGSASCPEGGLVIDRT